MGNTNSFVARTSHGLVHNNTLARRYEDRLIILAQGVDCHDQDVHTSSFSYLRNKLGSDFSTSSDEQGEYTSDQQKVHFIIRIVKTKTAFQDALETEGHHVIYDGHSRYGRGACFDVYTGKANQHGDQWEEGTTNENGLFRLGYPYVPVELEDLGHHQYHFAPVPVEAGEPPSGKSHPYNRHPHARRRLEKIKLPARFREYVLPAFRSATNRYFGYARQGSPHEILLYAGWENTRNKPFDLGATNLRCKVFCHFGCSSRLHFWHIVRRSEYKDWQTDSPPTDKFAYFTTAPSDERITPIWLYYLLKYDQQNNFESWWNSLEYAKRKTNRKLNSIRAGYNVY